MSDLISDWGGFEQLVASLHDSGEVSVERNVILQGRSGAPRQIDVVVRHRQGLYEHLIIIECKYWSSRISRLHVDALATAMREVNASRAVLFSTLGFETGAETQARAEGIELFRVRDLSDLEWGLPGPVLDLTLQIWQRTVYDLRIQESVVARLGPRPPVVPTLHLNLSDDPPSSGGYSTMSSDGKPLQSLEARLSAASMIALNKFSTPSRLFNHGSECQLYMSGTVDVVPTDGFLLPLDGGVLRIGRVTFQLGMKVRQSRIHVDRRSGFVFALAVENCLDRSVHVASRRAGDAVTVLEPVRVRTSQTDDASQAVRSGMVITARVKGFFDVAEMGRVRSG